MRDGLASRRDGMGKFYERSLAPGLELTRNGIPRLALTTVRTSGSPFICTNSEALLPFALTVELPGRRR